jgi:DUF4097 and DUF4098 domain-containing protein YvlB
MRHPAVLLSLLAVGCSYPQFIAKKTVEFTVPVAGVTELDAVTHNGPIHVTGVAAAEMISVRAEMSVRGMTQDEADANLHLLQVTNDVVAGKLQLRGKYPSGELNNRSPSFAFTVTMPGHLGVRLESHNGGLHVTGTEGPVALTTHNGGIEGTVTGAPLVATTHNGGIKLRLTSSKALDAAVTTHNGSVKVALPAAANAMLVAETHNGGISAPAGLQDARTARNRVQGRLGDGSGKLQVETHNGSISFD